MKKIIRKFYKVFKKIIWLMIISIIGLLLSIFLMGLFMVNRPEAILEFLETSKITKEVIPFSILSFLAMGFGILLTASVVIVVIKMIFPNTKAFSSLLMKDEADLLLDLPRRIRKEVLNNGK